MCFVCSLHVQLFWAKIISGTGASKPVTPGLHYKIPVFSDPAPGKS